jgi:DNA (cytosine-5)-methyltransferase 1
MIVDGCSGAGGWAEGLGALGRDSLGVELDSDAVATSRAAGHRVVQADVTAIDPRELLDGEDCEGLIFGPPCPSFSAGGKRLGRQDMPTIHRLVAELAEGIDNRASTTVLDPRSLLTVEPMRWVHLLGPEWVALEQVPAVLPIWQDMADVLSARGYSCWTGVVYAERYGVPQTRQRAVLLAHKHRTVSEPRATHRRWYPDRHRFASNPPDAHLPRWVSMSEALGWGMTERPSMTVTSGGTYTGGAETFGKGARNGIDRERAAGRWAPWMDTRPATTVQGDPRVAGPGHKDGRPGSGYPRQQDGAVRVTPSEAGVLQTFRADYPWHGKLGKQHMQAGNAVPPRLAEALLRVVVEQVSGGRLNLAALGI